MADVIPIPAGLDPDADKRVWIAPLGWRFEVLVRKGEFSRHPGGDMTDPTHRQACETYDLALCRAQEEAAPLGVRTIYAIGCAEEETKDQLIRRVRELIAEGATFVRLDDDATMTAPSRRVALESLGGARVPIKTLLARTLITALRLSFTGEPVHTLMSVDDVDCELTRQG